MVKAMTRFPKPNRLLFQIDGYRHFRRFLQRGHERRSLVFGHDGREETVLHRVAGEDIAEGRRNRAADAVVVERIDRRLPRRPAAEIALGDDDPGVAPRRSVEGKVRLSWPSASNRRSCKQHLAMPLRARPFEITRRQDLVRVQVGERSGQALAISRVNLSMGLKPCDRSAAGARRRAGRLPPPRRPWRATSDACARPDPGGRGNCGWWWRRSVRCGATHRH